MKVRTSFKEVWSSFILFSVFLLCYVLWNLLSFVLDACDVAVPTCDCQGLVHVAHVRCGTHYHPACGEHVVKASPCNQAVTFLIPFDNNRSPAGSSNSSLEGGECASGDPNAFYSSGPASAVSMDKLNTLPAPGNPHTGTNLRRSSSERLQVPEYVKTRSKSHVGSPLFSLRSKDKSKAKVDKKYRFSLSPHDNQQQATSGRRSVSSLLRRSDSGRPTLASEATPSHNANNDDATHEDHM